MIVFQKCGGNKNVENQWVMSICNVVDSNDKKGYTNKSKVKVPVQTGLAKNDEKTTHIGNMVQKGVLQILPQEV